MRRWSEGTLIQIPYVKPEPSKARLNGKKIIRCTNDGREFKTQKAAASHYGISPTAVGQSIKKRRATRDGLWFVNDYSRKGME